MIKLQLKFLEIIIGSPGVRQIIENNYNNFFTNTHDAQSVKQLDSILTKTICTL